MVRQRSAKPLSPSSNLGAASKKLNRTTPVVFIYTPCRGGGTGRRTGLKIPRVVTPVPVRFRSSAPKEKDFAVYAKSFLHVKPGTIGRHIMLRIKVPEKNFNNLQELSIFVVNLFNASCLLRSFSAIRFARGGYYDNC
ncbi:MAG: hypothetical protein H6Q72_3524 [Firmicutes bacterium]|nr:hypothetical protein [Bacillota bacterium]